MPLELDNAWRDMFEGLNMALFNNLNTPEALVSFGKLVSYMQQIPIPNKNGKHTGTALAKLDNILGLALDNNPDIEPSQKQLISDREDARKNKDFQKADELRKQLEEQGIGVRDTEYGPVWSRD